MNYPMKVYQIETEDGFEWTVEFPDVRGCVGGGETPDEAVKEAMENLKVHLEFMERKGLPLPTVTKIDDDVSGKLSLRIGKELHRKVKMQAENDGVSINHYISSVLAEKIGMQSMVSSLFSRLSTFFNQSNERSNIYKLSGVSYPKGGKEFGKQNQSPFGA